MITRKGGRKLFEPELVPFAKGMVPKGEVGVLREKE